MEQIKKFTFDVGWVLISSLIPLLIRFLTKPFLARWLGATGLGLYSLTLNIYGIGLLIANFGFFFALVKYVAQYKDNKEKLYQTISSGLISSIIFGIIIGGLLYAFSRPIAGFFNKPELVDLLLILAFIFPFASIFLSLLGLLNGLRQMRIYTILMITQSCLMILFIIIFVKFGLGVKGAIFGLVISNVVASILSLYFLRNFFNFKLRGYVQGAKKLLSFGGQMFGANALNLITNHSDIILIGYFLSAANVGYYSTAVAIASFFSLIPVAIQKITFPATSEFWSKNNYQALNKMIDKGMKYSACILLVLGLGVGFFAKEIMGLIFGPTFIHAALPLCVLLIARVIRGATIIPISNILPAIGRPDINLKIDAISAGMNVGLNILLIPRFGILGAAIATSISLLLGGAIMLIFLVKLLPVRIDFRWHMNTLGIACISLISFWGLKNLTNFYLAGGIILCLYAVLIFKFFLTKEDKAIFISLAYSLVLKR